MGEELTSFITISIVFAVVLGLGCLETTIQFSFYIEETHEFLDGDIYLGEKYLGTTQDGKLDVDVDELYPGEISIRGTYKDRPILFYFYFNESDMEYDEMDFTVTKNDIEFMTTDVVNMDISQIADEIFEGINKERKEQGITELKRSMLLDEVAKEHAEDMSNREYFSSISPDGKTVDDRLQDKQIFYFAATNNLMYLPITSTTNIAEETILTWLESPTTKSNILDKSKPLTWNQIGIGVSCSDEGKDSAKVCYVTALFTSSELWIEDELGKGYVSYYDLYVPGLGIDYDAKVKVNFTSSEAVDFYIVSDESDYNDLLKRNPVDEIVEKRDIKRYSDTITINPGNGIIIDASDSYLDVKYTLSVKYDP